MARAFAPALLLSLLPLAACHDDATGPDDRIVAGVNLTELFAPASPAEVQTVLGEWADRDPRAAGIQEEASISVTLAGSPGTLRIVTHLVDGHRHVGAVLAPDDAPAGALPILVYAHGGDSGTSAGELQLIALAMDELADDVVLVAPAFRSEPLGFQGTELVAGGEPSPWDRDVDDALSLVRVAAQTVPGADLDRVGVLGFSRGAAVALLMGIRDPVVDRIVAFFGPTDFFGPWVQDVVAEALMGSPRDLPELEYLDQEFIQPLGNGQLGTDEFRLEMVRRSSVLFAGRLPPVQLHHGTDDEVVPVEQTLRLIDVMEGLSRTSSEFQAFVYQGGRHDPFTLSGSLERAAAFMEPLISGSAAPPPLTP